MKLTTIMNQLIMKNTAIILGLQNWLRNPHNFKGFGDHQETLEVARDEAEYELYILGKES